MNSNMAKEITITKSSSGVEYSMPLEYVISQLKNGRYKLTIQKHAEKRTVSQNALFWMWMACIEQQTGTDKQDVHDYYCVRFLRRETMINDRSTVVIGGTSKLNTLQMTNFMDKVKADAATEFGIMLPLPEDKYYEQFINEYKYR